MPNWLPKWPLFRLAEKPTIYCERRPKYARAIFSTLDAHLTHDPGSADLIWVRTDYHELHDTLRPDQLLNHIPGQGAMVDKGRLQESLAAYDAACTSGPTSKDFYPETHCLYIDSDRKRFLAGLPKQDSPRNLWIFKPTELSRGRGVMVLWRLGNLRKLYRHPDREHGRLQELLHSKYIAQRYLRDLLLLEGRKSEIRVYWLIACRDPLLVLLYPHGTVRLTTQPYKVGEFDNPLVHLTNVYQQKHHPEYDPELRLKWDFDELQTYLTRERGATPPDYIERELRAKLKTCLAIVVRAVAEQLRSTPGRGLHFGLYGADFILDNQLGPWLTEVQIAPGLSFDDAIKRAIIPDMLREAIQIVLEIQRKKRRREPLTPINSIQSFEWVINADETGTQLEV